MAIVIAATPYIFYSYNSFPHTKTWETFLFTYNANWYGEVYISMWTMMGKIVPLLLLTIWFFTCRHWWYHVLLIPIGMFLFQFISILNEDLRYFDNIEIWYVFPIMLVVVPLIYLIRAKLQDRLNPIDDKTFEEELKVRKNVFQQIRDLFR